MNNTNTNNDNNNNMIIITFFIHPNPYHRLTSLSQKGDNVCILIMKNIKI